MPSHTPWLLAAALTVTAGAARPQVTPAGPLEAMPLADYLGLLEQIAPAARQGAEAFLAAHRRHCGRALSTAELRLAMSRDGGDPILMAMIRASHRKDAGAVSALGRSVTCGGPR